MTTTATLAIPTVHLNGTSKEALIEGYFDAIDAVHKAGRVLASAYPNGRDYYPQGSAAISLAMSQHEARMQRLKEVAAELEAIVTEIQ